MLYNLIWIATQTLETSASFWISALGFESLSLQRRTWVSADGRNFASMHAAHLRFIPKYLAILTSIQCLNVGLSLIWVMSSNSWITACHWFSFSERDQRKQRLWLYLAWSDEMWWIFINSVKARPHDTIHRYHNFARKGCLKNPSFGWVCGGPVWMDSKLVFASRCFIYVRPTCRFAISDSSCCSNCESLQPPWVFRWSTTCTCSSTCSWWCLGYIFFKLLVPLQMKTRKHASNFARLLFFALVLVLC